MITGEKQTNRYRREYFRAILRQDISYFDAGNPSELTSRIASETFTIQGAIGEKVSTFIQTVAQAAAGFVVAYVKGWQLSLVLTSTLPALVMAAYLVTYAMQTSETRSKKAYERSGALAEQALMGVRTVLGLCGEKKETDQYENALNESLAVSSRYAAFSAFFMAFMMFVFLCDYALGFWYGSKLIYDRTYNSGTDGIYDVGAVLTIFFAIIIGALGLGQAPPCLSAFAKGRIAAANVLSVIDSKPIMNIEAKTGFTKERLGGEISLENLRFTYPTRPEQEIVKGINLTFTPGQKVALVGESGCGKSTIMQLVERFYDASEGAVKFDGVNIKDYNLKWLRQQIGYVGQEPVLFNTTVRENMLIGNSNASDDQIVDALKKAKAYDFLFQNGDKGLDTMVGSSGSKLSGGQKQRLAIARAIVKHPAIYLLDEATSALDRTNEIAIQKTLEEISVGVTTVVIAHRLSTIKDSDKIYVLDSGNVVEAGRHDELMAKGGKYYNLVITQEKIAQEAHGEAQASPDKKTATHDHPLNLDINSPTSAQPLISSTQVNPQFVQSPAQSAVIAPKKEEKQPEDDQFIRRLVTFNSAEYPLLIIGLVSSMVDGAVLPSMSIILSSMLDTLSMPNKPTYKDEASNIALWFFYLALICLSSKFIKFWMFNLVGDRLTAKLRVALYKKMLRMNIGWFDKETNQPGSLTATLSADCQQVQGLAGNIFGVILESIPAFITGMVIAFTANWKITLISLGISPLIVLVGRVKIKVMTGFSAKTDDAYKESGGLIGEAVNNMRTVASFSNQEKLLKIYDGMLSGVEGDVAKKGHIAGSLFGLAQLVMFGQNAVVFYLATYFQTQDGTSLKDLFMSIFAIMQAAMASGRATHFLPDVGAAKNSARRIFELLDTESPIDPEKCGTLKKQITGEIIFENVTFKYPTRDQQVLNKLSFVMRPGQKFALVGPSGCGKSTVLQLLQRFYDPDSGRILLDGHDIREYDIHDLRRQIGIVSQEPVLFNGTIEYNIKYAAEKASFEQMREAAREANALDFIEKNEFHELKHDDEHKPKVDDQGAGFHRQVGPKGSQISGGQKQRVAIARAILKEPRMYLFDEATSALDNVSEKVVQESLNKLMQKNTSITIAHRLSTIKDVDEILVLHQGQIIERGSYHELLAKQGVFHKMEAGTLDMNALYAK